MIQGVNVKDKVPLTFIRMRGGAIQTGLSVTVVVKDAKTGAVLRSSVSVPEVVGGSGIYTYDWAHGLTDETACIAIYSVGSNSYVEDFIIADNEISSRSA